MSCEPSESELYDPDPEVPDPGTPAELAIVKVAGDDLVSSDEALNGFSVVGTGDPGATVVLFLQGVEAGTVQVSQGGVWEFVYGPGDFGPRPDGPLVFDAVQKNASGDVIGQSQIAATLDTAAPAAPAVVLNSDTGSNNGDGITNDNQVNVNNLEQDATWEYSTDGGTNWAEGSGMSFSLTEGVFNAGDVRVRQADKAGNVSNEGQNGAAITYDATAPSLNGAVAQNDVDNSTDISLNDTVVFTFDEEVSSFGSVGGTAGLANGNAQLTGGGMSVTVTLAGTEQAGETVTLVGVPDIAGNTADFSYVLV